jgi:hypothetical protein
MRVARTSSGRARAVAHGRCAAGSAMLAPRLLAGGWDRGTASGGPICAGRMSAQRERRGPPRPERLATPASGAPVLLQLLPMLLRSRGGRYLLGILAVLRDRRAVPRRRCPLAADDRWACRAGALRSAAAPSRPRSRSAWTSSRMCSAAPRMPGASSSPHSDAAYEDPRLVMFSGSVQSACGFAQSAMGPFYCPADHKIYLDLAFFDELAPALRRARRFAQAYVIAHEAGHHVQTLLGVSAQKCNGRDKASLQGNRERAVGAPGAAGRLPGRSLGIPRGPCTRQILDPGDLEQALTAASAIGDDRLQRQAQGLCRPRQLHARQLGAAHALVQSRLRIR